MEKVILLSGGTGFIGQKLGRILVEKGYKIRLLCRDPNRITGMLSFPCEVIAWQNDQYALPPNALDQVTAVINLTGEPIADRPWTVKQKAKIISSRVLSARSLVDAICRENPPHLKSFLQASAIGYYGEGGDETLLESHPPGQDFLAETCQKWEATLQTLPSNYRSILLRIGLVLGREGGALPKLNQVYSSGFGANIGSGNNWVSWIHVDDLVALFVKALEHETFRGPINAVAPQAVLFHKFHHSLAKIWSVPSWPRIPRFLPRLALGERANLFLSSLKVYPDAALRIGFSFKFDTLADALADLYRDQQEAGVIHAVFHQWFPHSRNQIWPFFTEEKNLETITPTWLNFRVLEKSPSSPIHQNSTIHYRLRLHGFPIHWTTKISQWDPPTHFVDEQVSGPFKVWHHTHTFTELANGTLMTDTLQFKVPFRGFGPLIANTWVVKNVEQIFKGRAQALKKIFFEPHRPY